MSRRRGSDRHRVGSVFVAVSALLFAGTATAQSQTPDEAAAKSGAPAAAEAALLDKWQSVLQKRSTELQSARGELTEIDSNHSVVSRFTPHEPHLLSGMKPGESQTTNIDIKVYDLNHPDHLAHKGNLHLTFSYIGAYQVTVPAGTYEAVLIKWEYKGKVGPAKIQDTQYRFIAKGVGPVAFVEKKSISAMLVYHDDSKRGFLLHKVE